MISSPRDFSTEELLKKGFDEKPPARIVLSYENFKTEKYGTINFSASFPCFLPPEVYKKLDWELINEQADSTVEYFCMTGFKDKPKNSLEIQRIRKVAISHTAQTIFPIVSEETFKSEILKLASVLTVSAFFIDDFFEKDQGMADLGPERAMKVITLVEKFLTDSEDMEIDISSIYPFLFPYQVTAKAAYARMLEVSPQFQKTKHHFTRALKDSLLAMTCLQLAETDSSMRYGEDLGQTLHDKDVASAVVLELMLIFCKIQVPEEIRNTFLFQKALDKLDGMVRATNDIMSLGKEIRRGETSSRILKRVNEGKMTFEESFKIAEQEAISEIESMMCVCRVLRSLYPDNEELDRFVLLLGQQIDIAGHLFGGIEERYVGVSMKVVYTPES